MTKKHFKALAEALAGSRPPEGSVSEYQWVLDCAAVADACEKSNPRFDRDKFLVACSVPVQFHV